jgi:DNA repair protein RecO (recombination protein O)
MLTAKARRRKAHQLLPSCLCDFGGQIQAAAGGKTLTTERQYRTEAIVLKRSDFGEADRLLTLYTPERGKMRVVAKGVRRITSRKAGHVELFVRSRCMIHKGRDLDILAQAESVETFRALREDLRRAACAYFAAELLDGFTSEREEQAGIYELLAETLRRLNEGRDLWLATHYFEMRLLGFVGYRPELFFCVRCRAPLTPEGNVLDPSLGGLVCAKCSGDDPHLQTVSAQAFEVMRFLQTRPYAACAALPLTNRVRREVENLLETYDAYLLERRLKSASFLRDLRHRWQTLETQTVVESQIDTEHEATSGS